MEKVFDRKQAGAVAAELGLKRYEALVELVDSVRVTEARNLVLGILSCTRQQFEDIFHRLTGMALSLHADSIVTATIGHGPQAITLATEYGEMGVDEDNLRNYVAVGREEAEFSVLTDNPGLKNIEVRLTYLPEYQSWNTDMCRMRLLGADRLLMVIDAFHVLFAAQRDFITDLVEPLFSPERVSLAIYNADRVKPEEYAELVRFFITRMGEDYKVFPLFSEEISGKRIAKYAGDGLFTIDDILGGMRADAIGVRAAHMRDIDRFLQNGYEAELKELRRELEEISKEYAGILESVGIDRDIISESREHLLDNVRLFLENSSTAFYRTTTEEFAARFRKSLEEDIMKSEDIKQDVRSIPRYLTYVWELFTEEQNSRATAAVEKEIESLFTMMKLDLRRIAKTIPSDMIREKVTEMLKVSSNINSFFSRRTTSGNGLTDALTVGGLVVGIIGAPIGFAVMGASELVKVLGKKQIDEDYKRELVEKVDETVRKNSQLVIQQADRRIESLIRVFTDEVTAFYDDLAAEIEKTITDETARVNEAAATLARINSYIQ